MTNPMLAQFEPQPKGPRKDPAEIIRLIFGVLLLIVGGAVCIGVLVTIFRLVHGPGDPYILQRFITLEPGDLSINTPNGKITLPAQLLRPAGYGILIILLAFSTGIGVVMLKCGTALLRFTGILGELERIHRAEAREAGDIPQTRRS